MVITTSAPSSASAGVAAAIAPSRSSGSVLPSVRFHTRNSCPAAIRCRAIGAPILPKPKNPIFIGEIVEDSGQLLVVKGGKFVIESSNDNVPGTRRPQDCLCALDRLC